MRGQWRPRDPLPRTRQKLLELCGLSEAEVAAIDAAVEEEMHEAVAKAMAVARPQPPGAVGAFTPTTADRDGNGCRGCAGERRRRAVRVEPLASAAGVKNGDAVTLALEYLLANNPRPFWSAWTSASTARPSRPARG